MLPEPTDAAGLALTDQAANVTSGSTKVKASGAERT
jgi:hypothetical protein